MPIIRNRRDNELYQLYYKGYFVQTQLRLKISPNLAILYKEFMDKIELRDSCSEYLPEIMFTKLLNCNNENMVSVIIVHKEMKKRK